MFPGDDGSLPKQDRSSGIAIPLLIFSLTLLLMSFSIGAAFLNQPALAALAGTTAVDLAAETVRRLLMYLTARRPDTPAPAVTDTEPPQQR